MLFVLLRIDLKNLVRNKLMICKNYHILPSEIDKMVFFEYEYFLKAINKDVEEEEERQKEEQKEYDQYRTQMNPSNFSVPSFNGSSFGGMQMPTMPSF